MAENRENLLAQLNLVTKVMFEAGKLHRVRTVPDVKVQTDDGPRSPEQVAWFLENDNWEDDVVSYCGTSFCTSHVNLGSAEAARLEAKDDEELELVQRTSVTLADLYRKGRAKGVIAARSAYR
jgi:hypothetical protein